jgi:hypothetical protein
VDGALTGPAVPRPRSEPTHFARSPDAMFDVKRRLRGLVRAFDEPEQDAELVGADETRIGLVENAVARFADKAVTRSAGDFNPLRRY